jgi:hypothetical protein
MVMQAAKLNATTLSSYRDLRRLVLEQVARWRCPAHTASKKTVLTLKERKRLEKLAPTIKSPEKGTKTQGEGHGGDGGLSGGAKKMGGLLLGKRG